MNRKIGVQDKSIKMPKTIKMECKTKLYKCQELKKWIIFNKVMGVKEKYDRVEMVPCQKEENQENG